MLIRFSLSLSLSLPPLFPRELSFTGRPAEEVLQELQDALQRYQFVEQELVKRKRRLLIKEPEIRRCLDGVELLLQQRENATQQVG